MGQILIRNLPDDAINRLKTKAKIANKSLEQTVREILIAHTPFTPEERLAFSRAILEGQNGPFEPLSKEDYREGLL